MSSTPTESKGWVLRIPEEALTTNAAKALSPTARGLLPYWLLVWSKATGGGKHRCYKCIPFRWSGYELPISTKTFNRGRRDLERVGFLVIKNKKKGWCSYSDAWREYDPTLEEARKTQRHKERQVEQIEATKEHFENPTDTKPSREQFPTSKTESNRACSKRKKSPLPLVGNNSPHLKKKENITPPYPPTDGPDDLSLENYQREMGTLKSRRIPRAEKQQEAMHLVARYLGGKEHVSLVRNCMAQNRPGPTLRAMEALLSDTVLRDRVGSFEEWMQSQNRGSKNGPPQSNGAVVLGAGNSNDLCFALLSGNEDHIGKVDVADIVVKVLSLCMEQFKVPENVAVSKLGGIAKPLRASTAEGLEQAFMQAAGVSK